MRTLGTLTTQLRHRHMDNVLPHPRDPEVSAQLTTASCRASSRTDLRLTTAIPKAFGLFAVCVLTASTPACVSEDTRRAPGANQYGYDNRFNETPLPQQPSVAGACVDCGAANVAFRLSSLRIVEPDFGIYAQGIQLAVNQQLSSGAMNMIFGFGRYDYRVRSSSVELFRSAECADATSGRYSRTCRALGTSDRYDINNRETGTCSGPITSGANSQQLADFAPMGPCFDSTRKPMSLDVGPASFVLNEGMIAAAYSNEGDRLHQGLITGFARKGAGAGIVLRGDQFGLPLAVSVTDIVAPPTTQRLGEDGWNVTIAFEAERVNVERRGFGAF